MSAGVQSVLQDFIDAAEAALAEGGRDDFWAGHHHQITPLLGKSGGLLPAGQQKRLLFHAMRHAVAPKFSRQADFEVLRDAYRDLLPIIDDPRVNGFTRLVGLFRFGFDEKGALPEGHTMDVKEDARFAEFLVYAGTIISLPGQMKKVDKLANFVDLAPRILVTLRWLGYNHDRRYAKNPDLYNWADLTFWSMVHVALLDPSTAASLLEDFVDEALVLPQKNAQLDTLNRIVKAIAHQWPERDDKLAALADGLNRRSSERRMAAEAHQFQHALGLGYSPDDDWRVSISIPTKGGDWFREPKATLDLSAIPEFSWTVRIYATEQGNYSESNLGVLQNDMNLEPLGAGRLVEFRAWLLDSAQRLRLELDLTHANVSTGRNRVAAKKLTTWLASQG